MSQSLELPDDVYAALQQAAQANGTTPVGWVAHHLGKVEECNPPNGAKTLADLIAGRIGRIHSGGKEALSENTGEKFTDYVEQKRREGRL